MVVQPLHETRSWKSILNKHASSSECAPAYKRGDGAAAVRKLFPLMSKADRTSIIDRYSQPHPNEIRERRGLSTEDIVFNCARKHAKAMPSEQGAQAKLKKTFNTWGYWGGTDKREDPKVLTGNLPSPFPAFKRIKYPARMASKDAPWHRTPSGVLSHIFEELPDADKAAIVNRYYSSDTFSERLKLRRYSLRDEMSYYASMHCLQKIPGYEEMLENKRLPMENILPSDIRRTAMYYEGKEIWKSWKPIKLYESDIFRRENQSQC